MQSRARILAAGVTALIMLAMLWTIAVRSGDPEPSDTPEACLERMFQAMKAGDVAAYLDCFTGELLERLSNTAEAETERGFADYLRRLAAPIKGHAVLQHKTERSGPDRVRLVVDRVYADRQWEYQGYRLRREPGGWRIYAVDPAEPHDPPVPYGTPAAPAAPDRGAWKTPHARVQSWAAAPRRCHRSILTRT